MTIAEIQLRHSAAKVTDEKLAQMNASVLYGGHWERDKDGDIHYWQNKLVHIDTFPRDIGFEVIKIIDHAAFESLEVKRNPAFNQKVKVSVSDVGIMKIKHVTVLTDCCTQELQRYIDKGWCILAICPQPDQRRPDYVMGRVTDPNL